MKTPAQKLYEYWAQQADAGALMPVWEQLPLVERLAWARLWGHLPEILGAPDLEQMDRDLVAAWEQGREFQRQHSSLTELVRRDPLPSPASVSASAPETPKTWDQLHNESCKDPNCDMRIIETAEDPHHHRNCPLRNWRGGCELHRPECKC